MHNQYIKYYLNNSVAHHSVTAGDMVMAGTTGAHGDGGNFGSAR